MLEDRAQAPAKFKWSPSTAKTLLRCQKRLKLQTKAKCSDLVIWKMLVFRKTEKKKKENFSNSYSKHSTQCLLHRKTFQRQQCSNANTPSYSRLCIKLCQHPTNIQLKHHTTRQCTVHNVCWVCPHAWLATAGIDTIVLIRHKEINSEIVMRG